MTKLEELLGHEVDETARALISYRLRAGAGAVGAELATKLEEEAAPPAPPPEPEPPAQ